MSEQEWAIAGGHLVKNGAKFWYAAEAADYLNDLERRLRGLTDEVNELREIMAVREVAWRHEKEQAEAREEAWRIDAGELKLVLESTEYKLGVEKARAAELEAELRVRTQQHALAVDVGMKLSEKLTQVEAEDNKREDEVAGIVIRLTAEKVDLQAEAARYREALDVLMPLAHHAWDCGTEPPYLCTCRLKDITALCQGREDGASSTAGTSE